MGFIQKFENKGVWIHFCYEWLAEFYYNCGVIGHGKAMCNLSISHNQLTNGDKYGPWLDGVSLGANGAIAVEEGVTVMKMETESTQPVPDAHVDKGTWQGNKKQLHQSGGSQNSNSNSSSPALEANCDGRSIWAEVLKGPNSKYSLNRNKLTGHK
ncbi:hypothetical protein FEM48_Zijuj12G0020200 [Ziziphus jujuba var. spinosa]|uniref:Zinc knuckle CX2CX4HX4C domain-containing protein n=1 Tax=Ziziphus jujuba var. spinosa TaxID=714518 RepID=A0A978UAJ9_ZIZJJ|nr:hypothetical protein FEM48_Zijuj12G0020200 [Ziziphus jujuba var. spinosa]